MGDNLSVKISAISDDLLKSAVQIKDAPERIKQVLIESVNAVARATFEKSKDKIVDQVNLTRPYVDSKMRLDLASDSPTATITAAGRGVLLARFGATQVVRPASSRAKGSSKLGIPKGYRAAGVKVKVKAGGVGGNIEHGFFMTLRNGNGIGVFTRDRYGKVRVRYGPSVDQVFSGVSREMENEVTDNLEKEIVKGLEKI